jgi:hypothetical protein
MQLLPRRLDPQFRGFVEFIMKRVLRESEEDLLLRPLVNRSIRKHLQRDTRFGLPRFQRSGLRSRGHLLYPHEEHQIHPENTNLALHLGQRPFEELRDLLVGTVLVYGEGEEARVQINQLDAPLLKVHL